MTKTSVSLIRLRTASAILGWSRHRTEHALGEPVMVDGTPHWPRHVVEALRDAQPDLNGKINTTEAARRLGVKPFHATLVLRRASVARVTSGGAHYYEPTDVERVRLDRLANPPRHGRHRSYSDVASRDVPTSEGMDAIICAPSQRNQPKQVVKPRGRSRRANQTELDRQRDEVAAEIDRRRRRS